MYGIFSPKRLGKLDRVSYIRKIPDFLNFAKSLFQPFRPPGWRKRRKFALRGRTKKSYPSCGRPPGLASGAPWHCHPAPPTVPGAFFIQPLACILVSEKADKNGAAARKSHAREASPRPGSKQSSKQSPAAAGNPGEPLHFFARKKVAGGNQGQR